MLPYLNTKAENFDVKVDWKGIDSSLNSVFLSLLGPNLTQSAAVLPINSIQRCFATWPGSLIFLLTYNLDFDTPA